MSLSECTQSRADGVLSDHSNQDFRVSDDDLVDHHEEPFTDKEATPTNAVTTNDLRRKQDVDVGDKSYFSTPLATQRYQKVCAELERLQCKTVVDLGCGSCQLIRKVKNLPLVEEISGVDVDAVTLNLSASHCRPLTTDFLCPRARPLKMSLYLGDLTEFDFRIANADAVTLVEVIEHLNDASLSALPNVLFAELNPKNVIITTPNAEFNVLFENFEGMRHWDHKFEWTRAEFRAWCEEVSDRYGYSVSYDGVGEPPLGRGDAIGHCTQIALFTKRDHAVGAASSSKVGNYRLLCSERHPYETDQQRVTKKILAEVNAAIDELSTPDQLTEIPLEALVRSTPVGEHCTRDRLSVILRESFYELSANGTGLLVDRRPVHEVSWSDTDSSGGQFDDAEDDFSSGCFAWDCQPKRAPETWN